MENITNPYLLAAIGTGFTFLMTTLGAATIFYSKKKMKTKLAIHIFGLCGWCNDSGKCMEFIDSINGTGKRFRHD